MVANNNYLEENLAKLNLTDDRESIPIDIPINKNTIQKSIAKMDEIAQDAINSKQELINLMKSEKGDTGSITTYFKSMAATVDSQDEEDDNQPSASNLKLKPSEEEQQEAFSREDDTAKEEVPNEETTTEIPELIAISNKSSIYGSSKTILMVNNNQPQSEIVQIPVKSTSSIYGTSRELLQI